MLDAGLRAGETVALLWEDLDVAQALIEVRRGKGARDRIIPLTYATMAALRAADRHSSHHLVYNKTDRISPVSTRALNYLAAQLSRDLACHIHPHKLRHTYATECLRAGLTPADVQRLCGHANISTTSIYLHVAPDELASRVRRLLASPPQLQLELIA